MSGYAASARVVGATPRIVARGRERDRLEAWRPAEPTLVQVDEAAAPASVSIGERWDRFRERWAQLTFYVTDPESWR